jgi:hypothetical protein
MSSSPSWSTSSTRMFLVSPMLKAGRQSGRIGLWSVVQPVPVELKGVTRRQPLSGAIRARSCIPSPLNSIDWTALASAALSATGTLSLCALQLASPFPSSVRMIVLPDPGSTKTKSVRPSPSTSVERKSCTLAAVSAGALSVAVVK